MNMLRNVFSAFANLAASVNALAGVIDAAAGRLRQNLALDDTPLALPGEVLDNTTAETPSTRRKRS